MSPRIGMDNKKPCPYRDSSYDPSAAETVAISSQLQYIYIRIYMWQSCPLCLTNETLRHEDVGGSGCVDPHSVELGSSWRGLVYDKLAVRSVRSELLREVFEILLLSCAVSNLHNLPACLPITFKLTVLEVSCLNPVYVYSEQHSFHAE